MTFNLKLIRYINFVIKKSIFLILLSSCRKMHLMLNLKHFKIYITEIFSRWFLQVLPSFLPPSQWGYLTLKPGGMRGIYTHSHTQTDLPTMQMGGGGGGGGVIAQSSPSPPSYPVPKFHTDEGGRRGGEGRGGMQLWAIYLLSIEISILTYYL